MPVLMTSSIKSSSGRLRYMYDTPAHDGSAQRVLAAGGRNLKFIRDPVTGEILPDQPGTYLQRQFHNQLNRAFNPKRRLQAQSIILSFADDELTGTLKERAKQALQLSDDFMKSTLPPTASYVIAIQADGSGHKVHAHVLVNAIGTNGRAIQTSNFALFSLRHKVNDFMSEQSARITGQEWVNPIKAKDPDAKTTPDRVEVPAKSAWQQVIKDAVNDCKGRSSNVDDFKSQLESDYGVTITERGKSKAWTYHITDADGKEKKVRGYHQRINKTTGEIKSTSGLGRDFTNEAVTNFIAEAHKTKAAQATSPEPAPLSEAAATMKPVIDDVAAIESRMAANLKQTESHKEDKPMIFDDDIDEEELRRQADAETNAAKNRYANLMRDDLAAHHDPEPAPEQASVIDVAKQITETKQVIADTKAADAQAKYDDEQAARGMALSRSRHALATRLVTGFAEANDSVQTDSEESDNFGFLSKPVADWSEQDHNDFNTACHDAEASETAPATPDPAEVQARQVKAKVALLERDFGSSYADLYKNRADQKPEILKQARQAMVDYETDAEMTVPAGTVDKTGTIISGGSTSYSKLMVLARALKQVFAARLMYKQKITLRTIVRTTMQENRRTKATVQHNADLAKAKQDRIASDLEKWHVVPVGTQTAEQLHSSMTRDRAFAQSTIKTRGVTDARQKQQVYDETMGAKYTDNRNAWQVIHDRAMKSLDRSVANGLPGATQNDDLDL